MESKIRRLAIVIPYCHEHMTRLQLCMKTWIPLAEKLYEIIPVCTGNYDRNNLALNMREVFWKVLSLSYASHFARVDTDTYVWPERIEEIEWERSSYLGNHSSPPLSEPFMFHYATAPAYFLSRKSITLCAHSSLMYRHNGTPTVESADDRWVGRVMHENAIPLTIEPRLEKEEPWNLNKFIMWHGFGVERGRLKGCPY
jgi:hypothetical protein